MSGVYLERTDAGQNISRFYALDITRDLFGRWCVTKRWGRIGQGGQRRMLSFESPEDAQKRFDRVLRSKSRRGYSRL